jgi:hypothetical protein
MSIEYVFKSQSILVVLIFLVLQKRRYSQLVSYHFLDDIRFASQRALFGKIYFLNTRIQTLDLFLFFATIYNMFFLM